MTGKRVVLIVAAVVVIAGLLLVVLPEMGVVEWDLYRVERSTVYDGYSSSVRTIEADWNPTTSILVSYGDEGSPSYTMENSGVTSSSGNLQVKVDLRPTIWGSYRTPLYKSFTVEYLVKTDAATADGRFEFSVNATGRTKLKIVGLCSSSRALQMAKDEVVRRTAEYLQAQLAKR